MGKGGVGKTTVAAAVALGLSKRGLSDHLTTTDPAAHLKFVLDETGGISMNHIDEAEELKKYQSEVLAKARASGMSDEDIAYVEEDLELSLYPGDRCVPRLCRDRGKGRRSGSGYRHCTYWSYIAIAGIYPKL
jgi:cellulose biosynthesis protein BcsQ